MFVQVTAKNVGGVFLRHSVVLVHNSKLKQHAQQTEWRQSNKHKLTTNRIKHR